MGSVICVYRIMPRSPDGFEAVKQALERLRPDRLQEEPVAFGLVALVFTKIIPDASGEMEKLEHQLSAIPGAAVEEISVSRSL